jgi:hypothetical protein
MLKKYAIILTIFISACAKPQEVKIYKQNIEKPKIEFTMEALEKPDMIINEHGMVCMLPDEYNKEVNNYRKILDIVKQYQIADSYYNQIK